MASTPEPSQHDTAAAVETGPELTNGTHAFRTLASRDIYTGAIVALRADDVEMPGGQRATREVVEHPGAVAVVALDDEQQVTLVHQYRYPLDRRLWEVPAGLLDVQGEDPAAAAARELAEEVGLHARSWSVLVDVASSPGFTDQGERIFLARGLSEVGRPEPAEHEEADLVVQRFPLDEAVQMALRGEIVNAVAVAGLLAAQAVISERAQPRGVDAEWPSRPYRFAARRAR